MSTQRIDQWKSDIPFLTQLSMNDDEGSNSVMTNDPGSKGGNEGSQTVGHGGVDCIAKRDEVVAASSKGERMTVLRRKGRKRRG